MIQAHVVTDANIHLYEREFDEFLRRRHDVFVHQKKWRPASADGRERDQFDTSAATYVLGMQDGHVVTSARLIPCSEPTMVSEVFPHFCERKGVPTSASWGEWTRMFTLPEHRQGRRNTLTQICCAVMEYALDEGLEYVGGIQEAYFLPQWHHLGWRYEAMGLPQQVGDETYIVAFLEVSEEALARTRRILGIDHSLLVRRGLQRPFVREPIHA